MDEIILYFDITHAIEVHDWIIENSGGLAGINNLGLLESSLEHIQNDNYYPKIEDKLTHLVFSIIKFHAFTDANKRSSIALLPSHSKITNGKSTKSFTLRGIDDR